jgi:hypothetical protein
MQDATVRADIAAPMTQPYGLLHAQAYIRSHTGPDERIAVFPAFPRVYLETRRLPAIDSVYFLPWQAMWEASRPFEKSTCAQLQRARPRFVVMVPSTIWGLFPWKDYAAGIDRYVKENYTKLPDARFGGLLWRRSDAVAEE